MNMPTPNPNLLTIFAGDDVVSQLVQLLKNGQPVDLTGVTEIEMDFALDPNLSPSLALYAAKKSTGQIVISGNAVLGTFALSILGVNTAKFLSNCFNVDVDVVVTDVSGKMQTYRISNGLSVLQRNT